MKLRPRFLAGSWSGDLLAGRASVPAPATSVALVPDLDLPRFMGDWYVIASIATWLEKGAHNAKESYRLEADGTVATIFAFNAGAADGPVKTYTSRGIVLDTTTHAVWGQQYVWPFKADYRVSYISADYSQVVIAREKRDYVWIMSRTPTMSDADLRALADFVRSQGYDVAKLQRVPQASANAVPGAGAHER